MSTDAPAESGGQQVVDAGPLERALRESLEVFGTVTAEEMEAPSACEGWTVRTVLAHVTHSLATMAGLVNPQPYDPEEDFEPALDAQAREFARRPAGELLDLFRASMPTVLGTFQALPEEFAAMPVNMASAGTYPFGAMADALTFDHTCHIRWDVLQPRGPVRRDLPSLDAERLTASVRWLMRGIPQMTTARFRELLTDPITLVLVRPEATFRLVPQADTIAVESSPAGKARATVRTTAADFIVWGTGREPRQDRIRIDGDTAYADQVLEEFRVF
jgi:uncharacterized protein (TIGR03083 family)